MAFVNKTSVSASGVSGVPSNRTHTSKYCDVCYGVGKSFEEYTSHYVKSKVGPDGVVTCPTILNSICTYCKKKGHFKSACEVLKKKNAKASPTTKSDSEKKDLLIHLVKTYNNNNNKPIHNDKKRQRDGNLIHKNTFDCLFIGEDEDEDKDDNDNNYNNHKIGGCENNEFPPIPPPLVRSQTNKQPDREMKDNIHIKKMSYADALESAVKTFPSAVTSALATKSNAMGASLLAYVNNKPPPLVTTRKHKYNANGTRKSWADYSDNDTDSDSDYDYDD